MISVRYRTDAIARLKYGYSPDVIQHCNFTCRSVLVVTMNSIRAFNVRPGIQENPGYSPNPEPDTGAPSSGIAPFKPAAQPVAKEPANTLNSRPANTP
jgi:hypothetical protein